MAIFTSNRVVPSETALCTAAGPQGLKVCPTQAELALPASAHLQAIFQAFANAPTTVPGQGDTGNGVAGKAAKQNQRRHSNEHPPSPAPSLCPGKGQTWRPASCAVPWHPEGHAGRRL
jgi:hypothetical protein